MEKEIGITVANALGLPVLSRAKVLAGKEGLGRLVSSVNVMEVPDILDWVTPGQLLITTAYSFKNDVGLLRTLIPRLAGKGAAGLGVKSGRYIGEVPEEALEAADRLAFPVFEIPQDLSFSDIITSVLTRVLERQNNVLGEIHSLHQSLTNVMLSGGGLKDIGNILYQRFGNSIAISSDFFSSFVINSQPDKSRYIYKILQRDKRARGGPHGSSSKSSCRVEGETLGDIHCDRIAVPIFSDQILYGYIYIWEDSRRINSLELSAIESVTSLIALEIIKKISMIKMENDHKSGFLENLLSSDKRRYQKALDNARFYDFNPKVPHQVVLVRSRNEKKNFKSTDKTLFRLNTNIIGILQRMVKGNSFKILYVNNENSVVMLCEPAGSTGAEAEKEMRRFADELAAHFRQEYLAEQVVIGVGRLYRNPTDLYRSLAEAQRAARCSHMAMNDVIFYEDIGVYRLLAFESLRQESELFRDEMLGPLLDYDREKDAELIKTLSAYFRCNGNLTRLSEDVGVHYNTAVYRLQKIRSLSGFDLDNEYDLLNLRVALKINEMHNND